MTPMTRQEIEAWMTEQLGFTVFLNGTVSCKDEHGKPAITFPGVGHMRDISRLCCDLKEQLEETKARLAVANLAHSICQSQLDQAQNKLAELKKEWLEAKMSRKDLKTE